LRKRLTLGKALSNDQPNLVCVKTFPTGFIHITLYAANKSIFAAAQCLPIGSALQHADRISASLLVVMDLLFK
jgi:hypothetical protein